LRPTSTATAAPRSSGSSRRRSASPSPTSTDATRCSAAASSWRATGSARASTSTSPLPPLVAELRAALYERLAPVANRWHEALGLATRFPPALPEFLARCHAAGQTRPTPLLLTYEAGDYNCLHQDLYGEHVFPIQVAVLLSDPARDFTGGEFVLTEQRPRRQSRAEVVPLGLGDAVAFAVHDRPVQGARGTYRVNLRHGVSRVRSGRRRTLGLIFHDAA
jgi:hypothetical protein